MAFVRSNPRSSSGTERTDLLKLTPFFCCCCCFGWSAAILSNPVMKGKDRTGIKHFGVYQQVPANTSETLQSAGASPRVTAESEVVAASPSRGCPCCLGSPGDVSRPKLTAFPKVGGCGTGKDTPEFNSDLCDRQAPVSSFHAEEHQELHVFWLGVVALQQGETGGGGAWGQSPDEARGGCVVPWDGGPRCPGVCPGVHVTVRDDYCHSQNRSQIPAA